MSVFFRRILENKRYLLIIIGTVFICGICFGFYEYKHVSSSIQSLLSQLFYLNKEGFNNYQSFVISNGIYIFLCTYLSTSYLGYIGLTLLLFLKGVQISFSLMCVFSNIPFSFIILLLLFIQIIIEVVFCVCLHYMSTYISMYNMLITFYIEENFNIKSILNYKLNILIVSLIIFCIALAFRMYIVPMF